VPATPDPPPNHGLITKLINNDSSGKRPIPFSPDSTDGSKPTLASPLTLAGGLTYNYVIDRLGRRVIIGQPFWTIPARVRGLARVGLEPTVLSGPARIVLFPLLTTVQLLASAVSSKFVQ